MLEHAAASHPQNDGFEVSVANQQSAHPIDERQLAEAAKAVLRDSPFRSAAISLAVVDDATMHELNRRHLDHDWPTDVLSFVLDSSGQHLEGEVILSADTAAAAAEEAGWPAAAEQLLYVVHGTLHLVGHDDRTAEAAQAMRAQEARYLRQLGVEPGHEALDRFLPAHRDAADTAADRGAPAP